MIVTVLMVALLGVGAMVIDLGAAYVEKRQLQNGADAGALAVAQDCAQTANCGTNPGIAQNYANLNANDGTSKVDVVCGKGPGLSPCTGPAPTAAAAATGWVRVSTSTRTPSGGNQVDFVLGPVVGSVTGKTLHASAAAAWGGMGSGDIMPLTFSVCEWIGMGGSLATGTFPAGRFYIYFHGVGGKKETGVGSCTPSPSGQDLPGGFGYLASSSCVTSLVAGAWVGIEPGNSLPKGCNPAAWMNTEVLIAIFDQERGTGNNGEYHIAGFVGFQLLGYKFQGNKKSPSSFQCPLASGNSGVCLYGEFTRFTTDASSFGGTDYGARVVKMVG
ncbi:MAG: pilus assembly protein TadG-related protein [Actinomycetota bacterium]